MFDALPDEVIIRIFKELHVYDILNCSLTCRLFHETIRDTVVLQYRMELDISGVEDGDAECRLSAAERLDQLKTIEQGWENLRFRQKHKAKLPLSNVWELFGGVLAQGVMTPIARGLSFIRLPSVARGTGLHTWQHPDMGVDIRDFAIDPAQDLAALIAHPDIIVSTLVEPTRKFLIHLRTMSGGGHHPSASEPVLSCVASYSGPEYDFVIQIMGDFLAVLFHTPNPFTSWADELFIWDWKKAQILTHMKPPPSVRTKIHSVSFLSPRHFITSMSRAQDHEDPPALEVYDFLAPLPEGSTTPRLVRRYELPPLTQNTRTLFMITRSDPSPEPSPAPLSSYAKPFYTAPTSRLLTVSMRFHSPIFVYSCMLFVHHSSLLEGLEPDSMLNEVIVPWENWGNSKTRLMTQWFSEDTWVCYVHGTRYVHREPSLRRGLYRIRMLDFNPLAIRRAYKNPPSEDTDTSSSDIDAEPSFRTIVSESQPTILPTHESPFTQRIVTTLPYRDVTSRETFRYSAVMIDEDCIVGRRIPPTSQIHSGRVEVEFQCI